MSAADVTAPAADLVARFGSGTVRVLAHRLAGGEPHDAVLAAVPVPGFAEAAAAVVTAGRARRWDDGTTAAYLLGIADGYEHQAAQVSVETVWSGPSTDAVPVRAGAQVLDDLVAHARTELLLMTYSARPRASLTAALQAAAVRGVRIDVVVETLAGAAGAIGGSEPAVAFSGVPGLRLWHWPATVRAEPGAKMHAKVAVADRSALLVTSANLTQSGASKNLEAGLLVRGGHTAVRVVEHVTQLQIDGVLVKLTGPA